MISQFTKTLSNIFVFVCGLCIVVGLAGVGAYIANQSVKQDTTKPCVSITTGIIDSNLTNVKPTKRWRFNSNGRSQRYIYLSSTGRENRMIELLSHYDNAPDYEVRKVVARIHRVYPEILICISFSDSSLGNFLLTPNNFGNVNNNDRGNKQAYTTPEAGINAIGRTLNNQYMKNKIEIGDLSYAGNCKTDCGKVYATSNQNWEINVLNCLGMIRNKGVNPNFNFRW